MSMKLLLVLATCLCYPATTSRIKTDNRFIGILSRLQTRSSQTTHERVKHDGGPSGHGQDGATEGGWSATADLRGHRPFLSDASLDCCPTVTEVTPRVTAVNWHGIVQELFYTDNFTQTFYETVCVADIKDRPCRFIDARYQGRSRCVQQYSYVYAIGRTFGSMEQYRFDLIRVATGCRCRLLPEKPTHREAGDRASNGPAHHRQPTLPIIDESAVTSPSNGHALADGYRHDRHPSIHAPTSGGRGSDDGFQAGRVSVGRYELNPTIGAGHKLPTAGYVDDDLSYTDDAYDDGQIPSSDQHADDRPVYDYGSYPGPAHRGDDVTAASTDVSPVADDRPGQAAHRGDDYPEYPAYGGTDDVDTSGRQYDPDDEYITGSDDNDDETMKPSAVRQRQE